MSGYVYKGTVRDVEDPAQPKPATGIFDPAKCGTYAGYRQHQKYHQPTCPECRAVKAKKNAEYRGGYKVRAFNPSACGTRAGYRRHERHNVPACDPCKAAQADYMHDYRTSKTREESSTALRKTT